MIFFYKIVKQNKTYQFNCFELRFLYGKGFYTENGKTE